MIAVPSEAQANKDLKITANWLLVAFFLGQVALVVRLILQTHSNHLAAIEQPHTFKLSLASGTLAYSTAAAFVWSLAWVTAGFLFGFIFGIPKVIGASSESPSLPDRPTATPAKLKVNTNLEDISDWLTKILVGATLTQIVKIPTAISSGAAFMAGYDQQVVSFNAAILIYYSALGLLSGYILTRMFFARAFAIADQGTPLLPPGAAKLLDEATIQFGRFPKTEEDTSLREAVDASNKVPLTKSLSSAEALRLAKAASFGLNARRALDASEIALEKSPRDPEALLTYAWSLRQSGSSVNNVLPYVQQAAGYTSKDTDHATLTSVYQSLSFLHLYQPPPDGFNAALKTIAEYESKGGRPNAGIEINRASAFGQKYRYLRDGDTTTPPSDTLKRELKDARDNALRAVTTALDLESASAQRLKELLWVLGDSQDDDLSCFQDDPSFTELLPNPTR